MSKANQPNQARPQSRPSQPFGDLREVSDIDRTQYSEILASRPSRTGVADFHGIDGMTQSEWEEGHTYGPPRLLSLNCTWDAFWQALLLILLVIAAIVLLGGLGAGKGVI